MFVKSSSTILQRKKRNSYNKQLKIPKFKIQGRGHLPKWVNIIGFNWQTNYSQSQGLQKGIVVPNLKKIVHKLRHFERRYKQCIQIKLFITLKTCSRNQNRCSFQFKKSTNTTYVIVFAIKIRYKLPTSPYLVPTSPQ